MSDQHTLAVAHLAVFTREVAPRRCVLQTFGDGGGESTTRVGISEEHVDHRRSHFLTTEPHLHHGRNIVGPRHVDRCASVHQDDGAWIGGCHLADQLGLSSRQRQCFAVVTFALPLVVGTHHDNGQIALGRQVHGTTHRIIGFDELQSDSSPVHPLALFAITFENEFSGFAGRQLDDRRDLDAAHAKERMTSFGDGGRPVDDAVTVDEQTTRTHFDE